MTGDDGAEDTVGEQHPDPAVVLSRCPECQTKVSGDSQSEWGGFDCPACDAVRNRVGLTDAYFWNGNRWQIKAERTGLRR